MSDASSQQSQSSQYSLENLHDSRSLICHELRTPLTSIQGVLKILEIEYAQTQNMSEDSAKLLKLAFNSVSRLTKLAERIESQQISFSETISQHDIKMLQLEADLLGGLERQEFFLNYQPIINSQNGKIIGFEALGRWHHPSQGMIPPNIFIALAERSGFIKDLGLFFLDLACRQLSQWQAKFPSDPPLIMSINLSTVQFSDRDLCQKIEAIFTQYPIQSGTLRLEVTESSLFGMKDNVLEIIHNLQRANFKVYLDDFGTGYSSLSRLQSLPFDALKIDKSFVLARNWLMSEIIFSLARRLNLDVIAEGIETAEQLMMLKKMGCQKMQGFLFSKPISEALASQLLESKTTFKTLN